MISFDFQDRYAFKKGMPVLDDQQDWKLINGYENETHTMLQFSRKFDTCDHQDFPITVTHIQIS